MWTKEKVISTEWDGHKFEFKIRTITYGEKTRMINDATISKIVNGKEEFTIDNMKFQMGLLRKAVEEIIVDGKKENVNIQTIEGLPPSVGDFLYNEAQVFCGLFREEDEKTDED